MNFETIYKALRPDYCRQFNPKILLNKILHCGVWVPTTWWGLFSRSCLVFTIGYSYSMAGSAWRRRCGGSCHCMTACACISCLLAIFARPRPFAVFTKNCELSFNGKKSLLRNTANWICKTSRTDHCYTSATRAPPPPPFLKGPMGGNPIRPSTQWSWIKFSVRKIYE